MTTQPAQPGTTSPQPLQGVGVLQPQGQACRDAPACVPPRTTTTRRVMTLLVSLRFKPCLSQAGREGTRRAASTVASAGSGSPQPRFPQRPLWCRCPRRMGHAWSLPLSPGLPRTTHESSTRGALLPAEDTGHPHTCPHHTSTSFHLQTPGSGLRGFLPAGPAGAQPHPGHCLGVAEGSRCVMCPHYLDGENVRLVPWPCPCLPPAASGAALMQHRGRFYPETHTPHTPPQPPPHCSLAESSRLGQDSPLLPPEGGSPQGRRFPPSNHSPPAPRPRVGFPACPHPRSRAGGVGRAPCFPSGALATALPKSQEAKHRRGQRQRKPLRFLPARGEPSRRVALPRAPFAGSLRWEEKLSSFPRSPTHFNELSGGTPPRRLPRIHPPSSPAPFKEASGGGWTLAGLSAWPRGWALPAWFFWKRAATCPAQRAGAALSPSGNASSRRPFPSHPQALMSGGKFGCRVS